MRGSSLFALTCVLLASAPVRGQNTLEQNRKLCGDNNSIADVRIGACTAVIQSGQFAPADLAIATANRGLAYLDNEDFARARADFDQSLRIDARCAVAYRGRGMLLGKLKDFDRALADHARAIEIEPSAASHYARGVTYLDMANNREAIASFSRAITLNDGLADAYMLRGLASLRAGDYPNAIADCTKAIARDAGEAAAYFNRALAYVKSNDPDKALIDFSSYVKLEPAKVEGWYQRGEVYYQKNDLPKALDDFNHVLAIKPDNASALFERGRVHMAAGRYESAIADFTRVLSIDPSGFGAASHYNRAQSLVKTGDRARAFPDYEAAATLDPADADAPGRLVEVGVALKRYADAEKYLLVLFNRFPATVKDQKSNLLQIVRFRQIAGDWQKADDLLNRYVKTAAPAAGAGGRASASVPVLDDEPVNRSRARTAAALGRSTEALDLLRQIDTLYTSVLARADKGFAALWDTPAFAAAVDLKAQSARELAKTEQQQQASPAKLEPIVARMRALRNAERFEDAIQLGQRTVELDLAKFTDRADEEVWVYNETARSARALGDAARAELAYRTGIDRLGTNGSVVNIMLNGGVFLAYRGQSRDALAFADRAVTAGVSPYGAVIANTIRAVAYWSLKQQADLDRVVAELEKHVDDNPLSIVEVYCLLGRRDDAANLAAKLLADPARVDGVLLQLQRYQSGPTSPGPPRPAAQAFDTGWSSMLTHPAVIAALKPVGRITSIPSRGY